MGMQALTVTASGNPTAPGIPAPTFTSPIAGRITTPVYPAKAVIAGNGIVIGQVDGAVIEYCQAYENGWLNDYEAGGLDGIWTWDSNNVIIQFNESHHNRTGSSTDGGGFDLDGGVTNSILQYNYSHDNDGAGYLLAQFWGARAFFNNTVRYNISENDGRKNSYGAIHIWSTGASGGIRNTRIYHNTVYLRRPASGHPKAIDCETHGGKDIGFYNNLLATADGLTLARGQDAPGLVFRGNNYWSSDHAFSIVWNQQPFSDLKQWRAATGQELLDKAIAGMNRDPLLFDPGNGGTIGNPTQLAALKAYQLKDNSPMKAAGIQLKAVFGVNVGAQDFYGNALPQSEAPSIGAHEKPIRADRR
jgi:hypothetical protein